MAQKKGFKLILIFVLTVFIQRIEAQTLQKTANFQTQDIPVTISPENPAYCNPNVGVEVMVVENFNSYLWIAPTLPGQTTSSPPLTGKNAVLKKSGEWRLRVEYEVNGVVCMKEIKFYVGDLSNSNGIEAYFENAGFYSVSIFRENPTLVSVPECNPDPVTFVSGENYIDLNEAIQNVYNNFKPISEVTPSSIVLSENNCLCNVGIDMLENQFNEGSLSVWGHQFFKNSSDLDGKLFVKARMPGEERLPIQTQKEHLQEIHPLILSSNVGSQEHGRVIFSNLFMPHPIGGYEPEDLCDLLEDPDLDSYFLSPAGIPIQVYSGSSDFIFSNENNQEGIFEGALIKFQHDSKSYSAYWKSDFIFSGYFNDITAEIIEDFEIGENSGGDLTYIIPEVECNQCVPIIGFSDNISSQRNGQGDGGILSPMTKKIKTNEAGIKDMIYDLICAIRHGETSFDFKSPIFSNKVIIAKDLILGNTWFDYIGISIPPYSGNIATLTIPVENTLSSVSKGFETGIQIGTHNDFRITCFKRTCSSSKKGIGNYIFKRTKVVSYSAWPDAIISDRLLSTKFIPDINNTKNLKRYFDNNQNNDNLLIFVNGYRMNLSINSDYETSKRAIRCGDYFIDDGVGYWGSLASQFINRIQTNNVYYGDGHEEITTSNHNDGDDIYNSKIKFINSCLSSYCAAGKLEDGKKVIRGLLGPIWGFLINNYICPDGCLGNPDCVMLNTEPNYEGFGVRQFNGYVFGDDLAQKINQGKVKIKKNANGEVTGKIDIVAHSMGFAFAYGMARAILDADILAEGNTLGNFYVLAPENGCGAVGFVKENFESVWQYGTAENGPRPHRAWLRDGVAPQCAIPGLDWNIQPGGKYGRVRFQGEAGFINAHLGGNYGWVINNILNPLDPGYVRKR